VPYAFLWNGPNGYSSQQEDITTLAPGDYTLTITDANGCDTTVLVNVPSLSGLLADAGTDQQSCAGPDVVLDGSGSTGALSYEWTNDQGQLVGDQAIVTITDLLPGIYTFTLTVIDGVCTSTDQVVVEVLPLPNVNAGDPRTIFLGTSTTLGGAPSGPSGSTFTWEADTTLSATDVPNPIATPAATTWYILTVQAPDGCIGVDSVLVTVLPEVEIPSGFSPNADGWNDNWVIDLIERFPDCEVEIYNRWGEMLFRSVGYRTPWDGRYDGGPVPVGTYYYIVKLNDPDYPDAYTGPLTVIR
jgi:gliding motility-associated-like protein